MLCQAANRDRHAPGVSCRIERLGGLGGLKHEVDHASILLPSLAIPYRPILPNAICRCRAPFRLATRFRADGEVRRSNTP